MSRSANTPFAFTICFCAVIDRSDTNKLKSLSPGRLSRMLMNSVPHGKAAPNHAVATIVHQCRATPPSALPIAIHM